MNERREHIGNGSERAEGRSPSLERRSSNGRERERGSAPECKSAHETERERKGAPQRGPSRGFVVFSWVLVAAVAVFIFYMSAKSGDALEHRSGIISLLRNALNDAAAALFGHPVDVSPIGHFTEFFLLGGALANALRLSLPLKRACAYATLLASLYGITDELHQIFVPERSCDPLDWLVDTLAALLATLLFALIVRMHRKRADSGPRDA